MPSRAFVLTVVLLMILLQGAPRAEAQEPEKRPSDLMPLTPAITTYAGLGLGAFLPMRESFRLNYSTDLAGVPLEVLGFVQFPITERTITHVQVRFTRREANFIENSEIRMVQLEPSMRYYLQPPSIDKTEEGDRKTEFGLFAGFGGQISRTTVYGIVQETPDGNDPHPREVTKDHYNLGIGVDLGLTYPFSLASFVDAGIHVSTYLNDPVKLGGLGNLGGVSFNVAYRFGF
jgi:hypothetical protein